MFKRRNVEAVKKRVWRISATHPAGAFVTPAEAPSGRAGTDEVHERGCRASSLELSSGADVLETDMDTLPGELIDVFTKAGR